MSATEMVDPFSRREEHWRLWAGPLNSPSSIRQQNWCCRGRFAPTSIHRIWKDL